MAPLTTEDVFDLIDSYVTSAALNTALELGLFWLLAPQPLDAPAVARTLRRMLQDFLGPSFGQAIEIINQFREQTVKKQIPDSKDRVRFWEQAVTPELLDLARKGDLEGLIKALDNELAGFIKSNQ